MRLIRNKDTKPEKLLRSALHKLGFRYRLHVKNMPGKPDLVFPTRKKAIFVHGCFWHLHPNIACKDARLPKSNEQYWLLKLKRNVERDSQHIVSLNEQGWDVLVVWECEIQTDPTLVSRVTKWLNDID